MKRAWVQVGLLGVLSGGLAVGGLGQSVAEAARQQQQQQQAKPKAERHVYTNEDFPSRPADTTQTAAPEPQPQPAARPAAEGPKPPTPQELQNQVRAQKQKIKGLEARVAQIQRELELFSSVEGVTYGGMTIFTGSNAASYCAAVNAMNYPSAADRLYCAEPLILNAELERRQGELAEAKAELEMLQERLRRMGYRSNFYDPD